MPIFVPTKFLPHACLYTYPKPFCTSQPSPTGPSRRKGQFRNLACSFCSPGEFPFVFLGKASLLLLLIIMVGEWGCVCLSVCLKRGEALCVAGHTLYHHSLHPGDPPLKKGVVGGRWTLAWAEAPSSSYVVTSLDSSLPWVGDRIFMVTA